MLLLRIEQLYPFPAKSLAKELKPYIKNAKFYWCQEEPKNMGGWFFVRDYIDWTLEYIKAIPNDKFAFKNMTFSQQHYLKYALINLASYQKNKNIINAKETLDLDRFASIRVILNKPAYDAGLLEKFEDEISSFVLKGKWDKSEIVDLFKVMIPAFDHKETGKHLDNRM